MPSPKVIAAILVGPIAVTALTWRDLRHRSADQVRGKKKWWRLASPANSLNSSNSSNSLLSLLFGRKKTPRVA